jgi:hypothetical protein
MAPGRLDTEQLFNAVGGALLATITTSDNLLQTAAFAGVLSANETEDLRLNPRRAGVDRR